MNEVNQEYCAVCGQNEVGDPDGGRTGWSSCDDCGDKICRPCWQTKPYVLNEDKQAWYHICPNCNANSEWKTREELEKEGYKDAHTV